MMGPAMLMVVLAAEPVRIDARGLELSVVQRVLEAQLGALDQCWRAPPPPKLVIAEPFEPVVELAVAPTGAVAHAQLTNPGWLEAPCVERLLTRIEFGFAPRGVSAVSVVTAKLVCAKRRCRWSWTPPSAAPLTISRAWQRVSGGPIFFFSADGGFVTDDARRGDWSQRGGAVIGSMRTTDGGTDTIVFDPASQAADGGLFRPVWVPVASVERTQGATPCTERCPEGQTCLAKQVRCRKPPCPVLEQCVFDD